MPRNIIISACIALPLFTTPLAAQSTGWTDTTVNKSAATSATAPLPEPTKAPAQMAAVPSPPATDTVAPAAPVEDVADKDKKGSTAAPPEMCVKPLEAYKTLDSAISQLDTLEATFENLPEGLQNLVLFLQRAAPDPTADAATKHKPRRHRTTATSENTNVIPSGYVGVRTSEVAGALRDQLENLQGQAFRHLRQRKECRDFVPKAVGN